MHCRLHATSPIQNLSCTYSGELGYPLTCSLFGFFLQIFVCVSPPFSDAPPALIAVFPCTTTLFLLLPGLLWYTLMSQRFDKGRTDLPRKSIDYSLTKLTSASDLASSSWTEPSLTWVWGCCSPSSNSCPNLSTFRHFSLFFPVFLMMIATQV